jgi:hypothetical protein
MASPGASLSQAISRWRDRLTEAQWDSVRVLAVGAALLVGGYGLYRAAHPFWARWQNRQALAEAQRFADQKDYPNLVLALRRATELEPNDLATWQETARELAEIGSPEAIAAREQAARLAPGDEAMRVAWVEEALRFGRYDAAQAALAGFSAAAQREVAYHRLAVALATAEGGELEIERQLAALIAVEPGNLNARFTYAALRLWNADPVGAAAARAALSELQREPSVRIRATIELLAEAARQRDPARIEAVLGRSVGIFAPGTLRDFHGANSPAWNALLTGMQRAAESGPPSDAALLARWLADLGRRPAALAWLQGLAPAERDDSTVRDIAAELSAEESDLSALARLLGQGAWGVWPAAARSLALEARAQMQHGEAAKGRETWQAAIAASAGSLTGLRALGRLAVAWHDADGAEGAWSAIIARDPRAAWAYAALRGSYLARHDRGRLMALYTRWVTLAPRDDRLAAEWITLACVLDRITPDMALRARMLSPDVPGAAAAQAAILWRRGDAAGAAAILAGVPAAEKAQPDTAFWLALVDADLGLPGTAAALANADRAPRDGEELALLRVAAAKAGAPPPGRGL